MMKQYLGFKKQYPDKIVLFRMGDFFETFGDDAKTMSKILNITLTSRDKKKNATPLAGFPHKAIDQYLPKLVEAGYCVVIVDQLEDPKLAKGIVKRGITELVTPGVTYNDTILNHKENNFLASVYLNKNQAGIAFLDISTGEFLLAEGTNEYVDKLLNSFSPKEIIFDRTKKKEFENLFGTKFYSYPLEDWVFTLDAAKDRLLKQFETKSLKGCGVEGLATGGIAAGAILYYLDLTHLQQTGHITQLSRIE